MLFLSRFHTLFGCFCCHFEQVNVGCVFIYVLPRQGLLLSRMMSETCIKVQVNDVMLRTLLRCLCQSPSSPLLNLSYFTSKDKNSIHRKTKRKWYTNDAAQRWMKWHKFDIGYKSVQAKTGILRKDTKDRKATLI